MKTYQDRCNPIYADVPFMEIRGLYIPFPNIVEPKYDGEFAYLVKKNGVTFLANKKEYGRIRTDLAVTNSIDIPEDSIFTAELIWGRGTNFYDFLRHKLSDDFNLAVFGCLKYAGEDVWKQNDYIETRKLLESQTFYNKKVLLAPKVICHNKQELDGYFHLVTAQGYEGIVIKDPLSKFVDGETGRWAKWKHQADNDFAIIGFQSGSKRAKTLSVLVGYRLDGKIQRLTYVGGGFKIDEKEAILAVLKTIISGHSGDEYYVEPKIVITVQHYGIIRNEDGTINSLRHPQFKCVRFDKTVEQIDELK